MTVTILMKRLLQASKRPTVKGLACVLMLVLETR